MSAAVDILHARLPKAEGERLLPYDDATGKTVRAPEGFLSWGRGFNLEQCGSPGLFDVMEAYLISDIERRLMPMSWYGSAPGITDVRRSVLLEIAYNAGISGLLKFHRMLAFIAVGNWYEAAIECAVADPKLNASRYAPLRKLLDSTPP